MGLIHPVNIKELWKCWQLHRNMQIRNSCVGFGKWTIPRWICGRKEDNLQQQPTPPLSHPGKKQWWEVNPCPETWLSTSTCLRKGSLQDLSSFELSWFSALNLGSMNAPPFSRVSREIGSVNEKLERRPLLHCIQGNRRLMLRVDVYLI